MNNDMDKTLNANILIVDDNADNVSLLEMMLSFAGYVNVQSTTDPREVKALYQDNEFDLILLDIRMPHLDGFQILEQLSDNIKGDYLPVLVLTAEKSPEICLKALEAGAKDFITKPFDKTEVLNRIANILEVRTLYNERRKQAEILELKVQERTKELKSANAELEQHRQFAYETLGHQLVLLNQVIALIDMPVLYTDVLNVIAGVNNSMTALLGKAETKLLGSSIDVFLPVSLADIVNDRRIIKEDIGRIEEAHFNFANNEGNTSKFLCRTVIYRMNDGSPGGVICTLKQIT